MSDRTPWVVQAGAFLAKCHAQLESNDSLTRASAESWLGVAKADLKRSTEQVAFLKTCYALEVA
ncbi:MAG: hypothetical protein ACO3ST_10490 [Burkholderiaceae bacterium]